MSDPTSLVVRTIAQYAGRLHRLYDGKREVCVYDYADLKTIERVSCQVCSQCSTGLIKNSSSEMPSPSTSVVLSTWRAPATTCTYRRGSLSLDTRVFAWRRSNGWPAEVLMTLSKFTQYHVRTLASSVRRSGAARDASDPTHLDRRLRACAKVTILLVAPMKIHITIPTGFPQAITPDVV